MSDFRHQFYATDKDIFDLLASAKQKLTDGVLRELARERGIFYSPQATRDDLVEALSLLPFTLNELLSLMDRRETSRRNEKTTSVTLDADISIDELKAVIEEYQNQVGNTERVTSHKKGATALVMNVEYEDIDYSRTRLIQRQPQDASIQFSQQNGKTVIRLPASEKSKRVVEDLTGRLECRRKSAVIREAIELDANFTAEERTTFFTRLMSELQGHKLHGVTNLRIAPSQMSDDADQLDLDEDERAAAEREMLVVVRSMALSGENLIASAEYQGLRSRGFFITSITWKAAQVAPPYDIAHLHAEFDEGEAGRGFKYSVKGAFRFQGGVHTKTVRPVDDTEREKLYVLMEDTARRVLSGMRAARVTSTANKEKSDEAES